MAYPLSALGQTIKPSDLGPSNYHPKHQSATTHVRARIREETPTPVAKNTSSTTTSYDTTVTDISGGEYIADFSYAAWLWDIKGHIITNNHCSSDKKQLAKTKFEFIMEFGDCGSWCNPGICHMEHTFFGTDATLVKTDACLDYTALQISKDPYWYTSMFGFFQVQHSAPAVVDEIYIPQHPYGGYTKIALTDDDSGKKITDTDYSVRVKDMQFDGFITYIADTAGGSLGSPVYGDGSLKSNCTRNNWPPLEGSVLARGITRSSSYKGHRQKST